jgi:phage gp29-like protein
MGYDLFTSKSNLWREYSNPLRGLTLEALVSRIEQGERGALADLQWFYQAMERSDALICTVVSRRRSALLSMEWDVVAEPKASDAVLAREQAAFLHDIYDGIENLREACAFLSTAMFRGYAHVEKHFTDGKKFSRLEPVEQWFWCRRGMFGEWTYNREARSGADVGEHIERENFVIVEAPMALDRILSVQYFRRNMALTDWSSFLDVYGIPSLFFVGPPGATPEKEAEYMAIAQSIIKDGRGYLPNGTDIKYVSGGQAGRPPFRDHLDYLDKQITLVGTGGLLTMLTESGSGTLAGGAHQDAFNQVAKADAVLISEALQRDVDIPALAEAFPGWPVEASFQLGATFDPMMELLKQVEGGGAPAPAEATPPVAADGATDGRVAPVAASPGFEFGGDVLPTAVV